MSEKNLNTTTTLKQNAKPEAAIKAEMDKAYAKVKAQKMVDITIPEAYRGAFGDPLMFSVNGVRIEIPIGKKIQVPEPHYLHAQRLMKGAVISKNQKRLTPEEIYQD
jgi:hypothetical protein